MKVFLSWSGNLSKDVATEFSTWIPQVLQFVKPFLSSEDIEKGSRWGHEIAKNLEESAHGVFFVTKENIGAPWINFEAGALSKSLENSHVWTLLIDMKNSDLDEGPLRQFQTTLFTKKEVKNLVKDINSANEENALPDNVVDTSFEKWWPDLDESINQLISKYQGDDKHSIKPKEPQDTSTSNEILEEILGSVRNQERLLKDPEQLLPAEYFQYVFKKYKPANSISIHALKDLRNSEEQLRYLLSEINLKNSEDEFLISLSSEITEISTTLSRVTKYLERELVEKRLLYKKRFDL
ncbi:toll/interleukin-1 receptor domain-containing protein [Bacillus safensis]|uniref:TIR domain-containing protein n=1 Tax=Bacillus safensis TaxID=561879 RepID=UPI0022809C2D|nr:TIR domain-containing protein [Bacillus safensis]MCY7584604.1 toll/interleukin-1 receptor domain-containing protein [Bacillus safensis]MCY7587475.1 toll/interleukin-1 receptor domain-containing protein [Bacillus safensis]MCY7612274.1 toll/interleukin-1 receptor domain-containing protein [Bacillus safensis]